jgi:hypothetical protein
MSASEFQLRRTIPTCAAIRALCFPDKLFDFIHGLTDPDAFSANFYFNNARDLRVQVLVDAERKRPTIQSMQKDDRSIHDCLAYQALFIP